LRTGTLFFVYFKLFIHIISDSSNPYVLVIFTVRQLITLLCRCPVWRRQRCLSVCPSIRSSVTPSDHEIFTVSCMPERLLPGPVN